MTVSSSGFSVEALTLAHEDLAENRRLYNEWVTAYPCTDPIERGYLEQAFTALIEKRRLERLLATARADRVRTAELFLEQELEDELDHNMMMFNENCKDALRFLTRSAIGCRWAIGIWEGLEKRLAENGSWYHMDQIEAIQLLGCPARLDHLRYFETAYRVAMDCLITNVNPKQAKIDRLLDPKNTPKQLLDRDVKLWPGDPAESRARLQAIVDRELSRLRALEATLRTQYEVPARAQARDMALAALVPQELPLLRAMRMHEQSYVRALGAYRKAREQNADRRVPSWVPAREPDRSKLRPRPAFVVRRSPHRSPARPAGLRGSRAPSRGEPIPARSASERVLQGIPSLALRAGKTEGAET
jgi:hypothetical protein